MKRAEIEARTIEKMLKAKYRVPDTLLRQLRVAYADKAVQDGEEVKMNRLYTILAIVAHDHLGFGLKRNQRLLQAYSDKYAAFYDSGCNWRELMAECREKTGIIVRTGEEGDEIVEYMEEGEREANG